MANSTSLECVVQKVANSTSLFGVGGVESGKFH